MAKISRDLSVGMLHPRENLFNSGTLGSLNAEILVAADGANSFSLDLRGTFNLTVEVSGTVDGTNWIPIPMRPVNISSVAYVTSAAGVAPGVWQGKAAGYRTIRARCTAYTSGAATASLLANTALMDDSLLAQVSPLLVTATAAAGSAVTLTLPAPGVGLRHYITSVTIERLASAVLVPAAGGVAVTTTNIPGALVYSFPSDAAAQGTISTKREEYSSALATSVQNVATTIVFPVTTSVQWRATVTYYVAP